MGGLAHFLEDEGIATTQISLIKEHTQRVNPPRALWVPFELGRPLGSPNNPEFQKKVLKAVLGLLDAKEGPVLADFPEDAPDGGGPAQVVACPVSFAPPQLEGAAAQAQAFKQEAAGLKTWYRAALDERGRTTFGLSGLSIEQIVDLFSDFAQGQRVEPPDGVQMGNLLKMASEDLKAFYLEALSAQPGCAKSSRELNKWFWTETAANLVLRQVRKRCAGSQDKLLKLCGDLLLVPREWR